jgi:photoactive yellow protein
MTTTATTFVSSEVLARLGSLTQAQADSYDFGIVQVDNAGKIIIYNQYEADLAGITVQSSIGKSFFTQIAPCTNNGLFFGAFKKGVAAGSLDSTFAYTFTYKMKPTNVNIHLLHDSASGTNWVFVKTV